MQVGCVERNGGRVSAAYRDPRYTSAAPQVRATTGAAQGVAGGDLFTPPAGLPSRPPSPTSLNQLAACASPVPQPARREKPGGNSFIVTPLRSMVRGWAPLGGLSPGKIGVVAISGLLVQHPRGGEAGERERVHDHRTPRAPADPYHQETRYTRVA